MKTEVCLKARAFNQSIGSLRLTLSEEITKEDVDYTVSVIKEAVEYMRNMSPLYEDFLKKNNRAK